MPRTLAETIASRRRMYGTRLGDAAPMVWLELVDTLPLSEVKGKG